MESAQSKLSVGAMTTYFGIFKEPRGLIRLLQFIFAIFAFATACSGNSSETITTPNQSNTATASWSYPYNLKTTPIIGSNGTYTVTVSDSNDVKPSAEFFVFTGVTAMLLSLAFAVVYVIFDRQYRNDERLPIVDFIIAVIWTIFWFAGSAAWAKGVSNIRSQTNANAIALRTGLCQTSQCIEATAGTYANIIVSVIFGFLNFILWAGCAWFIYKETKFFKSRTAQQQPQGQPGNFSDIGSPNFPQQPQIRPPGSMG